MGVATAIGAAAAVAGAGAAIKGQRDAKKAGKRGQQIAKQQLDETRRQFDLTREDFAGQRGRGEAAGEELAALTGLQGAEAEQAALGRFRESPGQAFLRERQEKSLLRNQAKVGGLGGGNVLTALQEQAFGIASTQLGQRTSDLFGLANIGAGATASGAQVGAQLSGQTQAAFGNIAQANREAEASRASGLANIAGAFTGSGGVFESIGGLIPSRQPVVPGPTTTGAPI